MCFAAHIPNQSGLSMRDSRCSWEYRTSGPRSWATVELRIIVLTIATFGRLWLSTELGELTSGQCSFDMGFRT